MAVPEQFAPQRLADYLAVMTRAVFQAGVSWALVEKKWPAFERAFEGFDPVLVGAYGDADVERVAQEPGMLSSRKKIQATVHNARTFLELDRAPGGFAGYLRSFGSYGELSRDIKARFAFVGELSVYYFLFRVSEPVPPFEEWEQTVPGDHPRMREMVALARSRAAGATKPAPDPR